MAQLVPLDEPPEFTLVPLEQEPEFDALPEPKGVQASTDPMGLPDTGQPPLEDYEIQPPSMQVRAARAGVEYQKPAPSGHFLSSFAYDDANRLDAYKQSLSKYYGEDVQVRIGQETGEFEYLAPGSARWALVTPPGAMLETMQAAAGPTGVLLNELGAGIAAAITTKNPTLTNLSASTATFVSEIGRIYIGQAQGINQNVSDSEIINAALKQAGTGFALGFGADKAMQFGGFVLDMMKGRVGSKAILDQIDVSPAEAAQIEAQINDVVGAGRLRYTLAQASNDEDMLAAQELMSKSREFTKVFAQRFDEQQAAIREYYEAIGSAYDTNLTAMQTAQGIADVGQQMTERQILDAQRDLEIYRADVAASLDKLADTPWSPNSGSGVREFISTQQEAFRAWADEAAVKLNAAMGDAAFIFPVETSKFLKGARQETSNILIQSLRGKREALSNTIEIADDMDQTRLVKALYDPDTPLTFQQMWSTLSALKRVIRESESGLSTELPDVGMAKQMVKTLENDLSMASQGSDARVLYDDFIDHYRKEKTRLDRGTVGKVMTQKNGRYVMADEKIFQNTFTPNDARTTTEFMRVIGDNPEMVRGYQEAIGDFYKNGFRGGVVDANGNISKTKHDAFMRLYGPSMKAAGFTDLDMQMMQRYGAVGTVLRKKEEQLQRATDRINQTFEAKISNIRDPSQLFAIIKDPHTAVENIEMLKPMLASHPELLKGLQAHYRKNMSERIMGQFQGRDRILSHPKLNDFLFGKSGETGHIESIRALFGDGYADSLKTVATALEIAKREARFPNRSNTAFWADTVKNVARAYFGLFTRPGRFLTAIDRLRGRAANRVMVNAILNPDSAQQLAKLRSVDLRSRQAVTLISNMGGSALLADFQPEPSQTNMTQDQRNKVWQNEQSVQ